MTRVYLVVEGATEESFVKNVLAKLLWKNNVYPTARILGAAGQKGGRTNYARVKRDVELQLKQDRNAYCSTMIDYYGLGSGFPAHPAPENLTPNAKVRRIEQAVKEDVCRTVDLRAEVRFIPYLQLHEYEALLFSDPAAFAQGLHCPHLANRFQVIRDNFASPEEINNTPNSAPSKRILAEHPAYQKVIDGTQSAIAVGITAMRRECPHFDEWVTALEGLVDPKEW